MINFCRLFIHTLYVCSYIGKAVASANNLEDIVPLLKQVGGRHGTRGYNVPAEFFPVSLTQLRVV